ncbi:MAG: hypothetical protein WDZ91_12815 [Paenibacillaceae bacterium]
MGVKFKREYEHIVEEMAKAIINIQDCYDLFEMNQEEWSQMDHEEQMACITTLADDIFYGLGNLPVLTIGSGKIEYDATNHILKVSSVPQVTHLIHLI